MEGVIDFRSDTVTKPTQDMLAKASGATFNDDTLQGDPTARRLEGMVAEMAGMEAALFAPSGTQSNLIGIMSHCQRGDEYIVGQDAHTYLWEGGGAAVLGSIQPQPLELENNGTIAITKIENSIKPKQDYFARTKLLCLENTTHGKILPQKYLRQVREFTKTKGLKMHLDGARVFNAAVALNVNLNEITRYFDSVSICLSKGLGAPIGSVLCGTKAFIEKAKRWRKVLGGGMRQIGFIAATAIYALENNIDRLQEDHNNIKYLAMELEALPEITIIENSVHTNMMYIHRPSNYMALQKHLEKQNIIFPQEPIYGHEIRLVTHLDITRDDIIRVIKEIKQFYGA